MKVERAGSVPSASARLPAPPLQDTHTETRNGLMAPTAMPKPSGSAHCLSFLQCVLGFRDFFQEKNKHVETVLHEMMGHVGCCPQITQCIEGKWVVTEHAEDWPGAEHCWRGLMDSCMGTYSVIYFFARWQICTVVF